VGSALTPRPGTASAGSLTIKSFSNGYRPEIVTFPYKSRRSASSANFSKKCKKGVDN
jgi:hypothetical protein